MSEERRQPLDHTAIQVGQQFTMRQPTVATGGYVPSELDNARACLNSLITDVQDAMGQRYKDAVTEAGGDISVNTAFKVAIRDEREAARMAIDELRLACQALAHELRQAAEIVVEQHAPGVTTVRYDGRLQAWAERLEQLCEP